jgi:hypothetical protein
MALDYMLKTATMTLDDEVEKLLLDTLPDAQAIRDIEPPARFSVDNEYLFATGIHFPNRPVGQIAGHPFTGNGVTIAFRLDKFKTDEATIQMLRCVDALLRHTDSDLIFYFHESTEAQLARLDGRLYLRRDDHPRALWKLGGYKELITLPYEEIPLPFSFD